MSTPVTEEAAILRPEISTAALPSAESSGPSAMSEVTDNASMNIDPYELTEAVRGAAEAARAKMEGAGKVVERDGDLREFWKGLLDDVFGRRDARGA